MKIYKFLHSCLLVEKNGAKLLIDPGVFSFIEHLLKPDFFAGISGVLLTHQHDDHIDVESLKTILEFNKSARIIANTDTVAYLQTHDLAAEVTNEGTIEIDEFSIDIIPAIHQPILREVPQNSALVIDKTLLHPGDSLDPRLSVYKNISVLALPIMAPWATACEIAAFAEMIAPKTVIPIHDGYAKEFFLERQYGHFSRYFIERHIGFHPLKFGTDPLDTDA